MARTEARIHTSIWRDADWRSLTMPAQWLYELLLSQPMVSFCGVLGLMPTRWAKMARGMTSSKVMSILTELERARFVLVDHDTEEVWIRSFVKWDGVLDHPGLTTAMMKEYSTIQSEPIRDGFLDGLPDGFLDGLPERFPKWFGGPKEKLIPDEFRYGIEERSSAHATRAGTCAPISPTPTSNPIPVAASQTSDARSEADRIVREWWDSKSPKPVAKFIGVVKLVERFIEAGHFPPAVAQALHDAPAQTIGAMEFQLNKPGSKQVSTAVERSWRNILEDDGDEPRGEDSPARNGYGLAPTRALEAGT